MKLLPIALAFSILAFASCEQESPPAEDPAPSVSDVTPEEASKLLEEDPGLTVLDVRTPGEFAEGHIAGAVNIDYNDPSFDEKVAGLEKAHPYLIHCASGGRSGKALPKLEASGIEKLYHMPAGMNGWKDADFPVEK